MAVPSRAPEISLAIAMRMAPPALMVPPPVAVVPGAQSFLNVPFALIPGFRLLRLDLHIPANPRPGSPDRKSVV